MNTPSAEGTRRNREKKRITEGCWVLDVADVPRRGASGSPCGVMQARKIDGNEKNLRLRYTLEGDYENAVLTLNYPVGGGPLRRIDQRIGLLFTRQRFGGRRHWFACPFVVDGTVCGRRIGKLYLPFGESLFGCRQCHDLTYRSSQQSRRHDRICRLLSGGSPEAEEVLRRIFATRARRRRRRALETPSRNLLEACDEALRRDLHASRSCR